MRKKIAKVTETYLGLEDHGMFTATVVVDYGDSSQGSPIYELDTFKQGKGRMGTALGLTFIMRLLRAFGVNQWENLMGRTAYALFDPENKRHERMIAGFSPLPTETGETFIFKDLMEEFREDGED